MVSEDSMYNLRRIYTTIETDEYLSTINTGADYAGFFGNPDAIHFATAALPGAKDSMGVRLQAEYKLEWLGVLVVADILFGVIENRDEAGVQIISAV